MNRTILITLSLLTCLEPPTDALEKVEQYGNPKAFVFHGTKVFPPEQLRRSLHGTPGPPRLQKLHADSLTGQASQD